MGDETTSPRNVSVSGGALNLTATKSGSSYTSGLVTTDNFKEFQYGYVEARIDIPQGVGFLPGILDAPRQPRRWPGRDRHHGMGRR
jgi:beta-glucanase (GH16 family)